MSSKPTALVKPVVVLWCDGIPENKISQTISDIVHGSTAPEKIILCHSAPLSIAEGPGNPIALEHYNPENRNPLLHLFYAHNNHPKAAVITAQAGKRYPDNWLQSLLSSHTQNPNEIVCAAAMVISCGLDQQVLSEDYWYVEKERGITHPALTALNSAGAVYPPFYFSKVKLSVANNLYNEIYNDDLWLKAVTLNQSIGVRTCTSHIKPETRIQATNAQCLKNQWEELKVELSLEAFPPWAIGQTERTTNVESVESVEPIDAVITWVNGNDPAHAEKLNRHLKTQNKGFQQTISKTRFSDMGEINLCIQSLLKFAPWIRTLFIVTDNQTPEIYNWLQTTPFKNRVKIIDHRTIFKGHESYLPTFNTRSIAAMLWNIPNLAEQFIFLNDDYLLTAPMTPEDFFRNGKVVLRGHWQCLITDALLYHLKSTVKRFRSKKPIRPKHSTSHLVSAKAAGFKYRYFYTQHNPHPFLRSTWRAFYTNHKEVMLKQISFKLRSADQFNIDSMSAHLNVKTGRAIIDNAIKTVIISPEKQNIDTIKKRLNKITDSDRKDFLCLQSLDNTDEETRNLIMSTAYKNTGTLTAPSLGDLLP